MNCMAGGLFAFFLDLLELGLVPFFISLSELCLSLQALFF